MPWLDVPGCVNCGCGGDPRCCVPRPPNRLRVVFSSRRGCECLSGYTLDIFFDGEFWRATPPAETLCGRLGSVSAGYGCFLFGPTCGLSGVGHAFSWSFRLVDSGRLWNTTANYSALAEEVGWINTGFGYFCYPLLGISLICQPFFFQARGVRVGSGQGDEPCEGGFDALIDITVFAPE